MIVSGLERDGDTFEAQVCVVGAGAAGLTLALALASRGISVVLVESGGKKFSWKYHKLLEVEASGIAGQRLMSNTRERFFGGTTNHWGGVCRPLDGFEFESHPWIPYSGWPITASDLAPYYEAAASLLGLPGVHRSYDAAALGVDDAAPFVAADERDVKPVIWNRVGNDRVRFAQWRHDEVANSQALTCVLHTTISELHPVRDGGRIDHLEGRTFAGSRLRFQAKDYVLCTGAIENARLLLASDSSNPAGLGNEHDTVGRYYLEHGGRRLGTLMRYPGAEPTQEERLATGELVGWATTDRVRKDQQLLGFMAFIAAGPNGPLPHELGVSGLHSGASALNIDSDALTRKLVLTNWEQAPNPASRITLSNQLDGLGVRKPAVHWSLTPLDVESLQRSAELLSLAVARSGQGRLHLNDLADLNVTRGGHQMGSTRMSADPKLGVTDADARVHSLENLFVGGSSLFATGGWQHPTFNIVTLSLRLADHLAARHGQ